MGYYHKIFITNLPAFYKIKLWNELTKMQKILVIFSGDTAGERNKDFFKGEMHFDVLWLNGGKISQCHQLAKILRSTNYKELILGGWDGLPVLMAALLSSKKKNACMVESSIYESQTKGLRGMVKRLFLRRISKTYVSGIPQEALVRELGFKKVCIKFGGCGILNYREQPPYEERKCVQRFLYVGRLAEVKNLQLLISVFNSLPQLTLEVVGFGPLEQELKAISRGNIKFLGAIENEKLEVIYKRADVFILPSSIEPWGLVIEEALNNGIPVIVSDHVGCREDLVTENTGLVFENNNAESLKQCITRVMDTTFYNRLRLGVSKMNFTERSHRMIECFK